MAEVWLLVPWCIVFSVCQGNDILPDIHNSYARDRRQAALFDNDDRQDDATKEPPVQWDCGSSLSGPSGEVMLPTMDENGTHFYYPNYKCRWSLSVTAGRAIMLSSVYFGLEDSPNGCEWDYIEIRDGSDNKSETKTKLCGYDPLTFISTTNKLFLYFHSDESYESTGFHFEYEEVPLLTPYDTLVCNSTIRGQRGDLGSIVDTKYQGSDNQADMSCFYRIQAPEKHVVWLEQIKIESDSVLTIYDGKHTHGNVLKVLSKGDTGSQMSLNRNVLLHCKESRSNGDEKFHITFSIQEEDEITTSPPSLPPPIEFDGNADCSKFYKDSLEQHIKSLRDKFGQYRDKKHFGNVFQNKLDPNAVIQAEFFNCDLEESENCTYDSVAIYFGGRKELIRKP